MVDGAGAPLAYGGLLAIKGLWDSWRSHRFGIYGIWGTGKTTLNNYLSTPGEIEDDDEAFATAHRYDREKGQYKLPLPSRKRVLIHKTHKVFKRTIQTTDLGGHIQYFNLWLRDMVSRKVDIVIYLVDHRHLEFPGNDDQQTVFSDFVDAVINRDFSFGDRKLQRKAKKYRPKMIALIANKADLWAGEESVATSNRRIGSHEIFDVFRNDLLRLQRAGIPTLKRSISALQGWDIEEMVWDLIHS